jgi:hypothetical protein
MQLDPQFAGLRQVFTYLTKDFNKKQDFKMLVNINSEFAEAVGYGLDYVFSPYKRVSKSNSRKIRNNSKLMYGLAAGIFISPRFLSGICYQTPAIVDSTATIASGSSTYLLGS